MNETIFRIKKTGNFVILDKEFLLNPSLSLKAKGLLSILLSFPDDWVIHPKYLLQHSRDGRDSLYSALKELKDAGYIMYTRRRVEGKFEAGEYIVYEKPSKPISSETLESEGISPHTAFPDVVKKPSSQQKVDQNLPQPDFPDVAPPQTEKPYPENPYAVTSYYINNKLTKTTAAEEINLEHGKLDQLPAQKLVEQKFAAVFSLSEEDFTIAEVLSDSQKQAIDFALRELAGASQLEPARLRSEVAQSLLDPKTFTAAGQDFRKKLNTILKLIRTGRWISPQKSTRHLTSVLHANKSSISPAHASLRELRYQLIELGSKRDGFKRCLESGFLAEDQHAKFKARISEFTTEIERLRKKCREITEAEIEVSTLPSMCLSQNIADSKRGGV